MADRDRPLGPSVPTRLVICLSGLVGGVVAVLADTIQKVDASAVARLAAVSRDVLEIPCRPYAAALVILAIAVALCAIFRPDSEVKAFYVGASIISLLMVVVPYRSAPGLASEVKDRKPVSGPGSAVPKGLWFGAVAEAQTPAEPRRPVVEVSTGKVVLFVIADSQEKGMSRVAITLKNRNDEIVARTHHDLRTDEASLPLREARIEFVREPGDYTLFVESPGFWIDILPLTVKAGETEDVKVLLKPTWVPVGIQRLWR